MSKVLFVFGTRPEAIKMAPLVIEFKKNPDIEVKVCVTGQHREMLDQVLEFFEIEPDYDLNIMKQQQSLGSITCSILTLLDEILVSFMPAHIFVHGDTTTTFAASLAAFCQQRVKSDPLTVTTNGLILIHLAYSGLASAITPAFRFCFSR